MRSWMLGAAMMLQPITAFAAGPQMSQVAVEQAAVVRDSALRAITTVPAGGQLQDYEAAILFAVDNLRFECPVVELGLTQAYDVTAAGVARDAISNVRRMCGRIAGTAAVGGTNAAILNFGPAIGGGGGGTGNYSNVQ